MIPSTLQKTEFIPQMMDQLEIPMPESGMASKYDEGIISCKLIGYPIMIRPSFVLGGRGMELSMIRISPKICDKAVGVTPTALFFLTAFYVMPSNARLMPADTEHVYSSVMEHVELAECSFRRFCL